MTRSTSDIVNLSGKWEFLPGDCAHPLLPMPLPAGLAVPGLWESQGHVDLDGPAWYRRRFDLPEDVSGWWTLRFGAVMDEATVYLNGHEAGTHFGGYTPFEFEVAEYLKPGANILEVRVVDHPRDGEEHTRSAHGKQGWMNQVFPSPPSLYMTYGGIWQDVTLSRHPQVHVHALRVLPDPANVVVEVELLNEGTDDCAADIVVELLGKRLNEHRPISPDGATTVRFLLGPSDATLWSPSDPVLHTLNVNILAADDTEHQTLRFGLRTFATRGSQFLLNGEPYAIRSALVQGFRADRLYAEGNRAEIEAEVRAAAAAGFNMLRLHIKAFDPLYLDVCDELGMLVHADIPIAEPIAHDELEESGLVAERSSTALLEQVRRDRNHPSLVLWSVMNELGAENLPIRKTAGYEAFVRRLHADLMDADGTRPVIENDWIEPDPGEVYCSPILTAHWYGRLSADYLAELTRKVSTFAKLGRPLFVSEFGDWGLPPCDRDDETPFWWAGEQLKQRIRDLPWPGTTEEFVTGTQRYQGISDRLQIEVFRAKHLSGWCLTELTDVPQEYNGLWDLDRRPKLATLDEIRAACQPVLPIVTRPNWTVWADEKISLPLHIDNCSAFSGRVDVAVSIDDVDVHAQTVEISAHEVTFLGELQVEPPHGSGCRQLTVTVVPQGTAQRWRNTYRLWSVARPAIDLPIDLSIAAELAAAVRGMGAWHAPDGPLLVPQRGLVRAQDAVRGAMAAGRNVIVLAQDAAAGPFLPFASASGIDLRTEWGSTPFAFTSGHGLLSALPPAAVLTTEALTVMPVTVWTRLDGTPWAEQTLVGLYKPYPGEVIGTVVGKKREGRSDVWLCQLPLAEPALRGDPAALSILADLVELASDSGNDGTGHE